MPKKSTTPSAPATHVLLVEGFGYGVSYPERGVGGVTIQVIAGVPEPLENFQAVEFAAHLVERGVVSWCDAAGEPALPPPIEPEPDVTGPSPEATGQSSEAGASAMLDSATPVEA